MRRSSYLQYDDTIDLGKRGFTVWAYGKNGRYVNSGDIILNSSQAQLLPPAPTRRQYQSFI